MQELTIRKFIKNAILEHVKHIELQYSDQQGKALDILHIIRDKILQQGFNLDKKFHYDFKFDSDLHNGVGTEIKLIVDYHDVESGTITTSVKLTNNDAGQ